MTPVNQMPPQQPAPQTNPLMAQADQIAEETGYSVEDVKQRIAQTGATTKEQLFPQFYAGSGIDQPAQPSQAPQDGPGGIPAPPTTDNRMRAQAAMNGQPMPPQDTAEGQEPPQNPQQEAAEDGGDMQIPQDVAEAVHKHLARRPPHRMQRPGAPRHAEPAPAHGHMPPPVRRGGY